MMPATLAVQLPPASLREGSDVFGYPSPESEPTRVEVHVRACLSFADLLGLLAFTNGVNVLDEELCDDDVIREALQYALLDTDLNSMEEKARQATAAFHGALRGPGISMDYMRRLGTAVTRVFGVTA
jgi:hypothetical protein